MLCRFNVVCREVTKNLPAVTAAVTEVDDRVELEDVVDEEPETEEGAE